MKQRMWLVVLAAMALAMWAFTAPGNPQEKEAPPMSEEMKAMMDAWMKYAAVGEPHKVLAERAGNWDVTVRMWMEPGGAVDESTGTVEASMIMGGRYLVEKYSGTAMGQPFSGMGISGYDNMKKAYVSIWIDSMGTGIMFSEGKAEGKTLHWVGDMPDPMTGKYRKTRGTDTMMDADHRTAESFDKGPDGKEFKNMELIYVRKK
jgi:hypothetical protein